METKHTPGPWEFSHREGQDKMYRTEVFSEEYGGIATCDWTVKQCGNGVISTYREANARLIAAAPELLDALIELDDCGGEIPSWSTRDKVRAAIAKATGEA